MLFAEFKTKTSNTNPLRQADVRGSFDFYTSIISLDDLAEKDITEFYKILKSMDVISDSARRQLSCEQYSLAVKVLPLVMHEYTHFIDATSTYWGLRHLQQMNDAYMCSDNRGGRETQFNAAKHFYDYCRRIKLPNYYTVINQNVLNTRPWHSNTSIGCLFSAAGVPTDRSVMFYRFFNAQGQLLARSPISTVSLLEASAMAQEIHTHLQLIQSTDPGYSVVERSLFEKETLSYLHNPHLTEYSVCAHILANRQRCTDVYVTFRMCSILSRLVLNFTDEVFEAISQKCPIGHLLNIPENDQFANAIRSGLLNKDHGSAFYLLSIALPKNSYISEKSFQQGVMAALDRVGTSQGDVLKSCDVRTAQIEKDLQSSDIKTISTLATAGLENYKLIDTMKFGLDFYALNLPPALLGDSTYARLFNSEKNILRDADIETCFNEMYEGQSWVDRFKEACV